MYIYIHTHTSTHTHTHTHTHAHTRAQTHTHTGQCGEGKEVQPGGAHQGAPLLEFNIHLGSPEKSLGAVSYSRFPAVNVFDGGRAQDNVGTGRKCNLVLLAEIEI